MPISTRQNNIRQRRILVEILKRIVASGGRWFTLPSVSVGIDASILPHVVPEGGRRAIHRLAEQGHLVHHGKKYRALPSSLQLLHDLASGSRSNDAHLDALLMTELEATPRDDQEVLDDGEVA